MDDPRVNPDQGARPEGWGRLLGRPGQIALLIAGVALVMNPGPRTLPERAPGASPATRSDSVLPGIPEVDWSTLGELDYETGELSSALSELVDREVLVPGFMVPLEDFAETVSEFLLVPYFGACVHTPPPPPNQLVYARLADSRGAAVEWWDPIWIRGRLTLDPEESVYGTASWSMTVDQILPYEF